MLGLLKREIKLNIAQPYWNLKGSFKYYDQKVYFPRNSVIFRRAVNEGIYEQEILNFILPLIKPDTDVFDIGANIGIMAIPMLAFDKSIQVLSVEASPNSLPFLNKTHQQSADSGRWLIIDKAIGEKEGKINFHVATSENGAYDSMNDTQRTPFSKVVEIDCTIIDTIWQSRHEPPVSLIKTDIEGADLLALKGGVKCIRKCKPAIAIEWNPFNIKPFGFTNRHLFEFTQSINYVIYALPRLSKIFNLMDLDLNSNYTENFLLMPNE